MPVAFGAANPPARRSGRTRLLLTALAIALAALILFAPAARAQAPASGCAPALHPSSDKGPLPGDTFWDADGDQCVDHPLDGEVDWQSVAGDVGWLPDQPETSDFSIFNAPGGAASKEQEPNGWSFDDGSPNDKSDVLNAWTYTSVGGGGDLFFHFAFETADKPGSVNYNFELNQLNETFHNDRGYDVPKRIDGDILLAFDWTGGQTAQITLCSWEGTDPAQPWLEGTWTDCHVLDQTIAQGTVNDAWTVANFLPGGQATMPEETFGEATVNLTEALGAEAGPCGFGQFWVRTRTSPSITADPKDVIMPQPIIVSNCGTVIIKKQTDPDDTKDPKTSFGFTASGFVAPATGSPDNDLSNGFSLTDDGTETIVKVIPGTNYVVAENDPSALGYAFDHVDCVEGGGTNTTPTVEDDANRRALIKLDAFETVTCTFFNDELGTVAVTKREGDPASAPTRIWTFRLTGGPPPGVDITKQATPANGGDALFSGLEAGTYTLCELDIPDGWTSDLGPKDAGGDACVEVVLEAGGAVAITATNTRPAIDLEKKLRNTTLAPGSAFVDGPIEAYVGDTLEYQTRVTNTGNTALALTWGDQLSASFVDARCDAGTITGPAEIAGDGDTAFEPGETWEFRCTHKLTASDPDPFTNTVKVTGTFNDVTVTDQDSTTADILHPAIDIEKTGPATAVAGSLITYTLTVKNPGDVSFAFGAVVVTDPLCKAAPPSRQSVNGDPSPDTLNPGDTWTYTCQVQTATTDTSVPNVSFVQATDHNQRVVNDQSPFTTVLTAPPAAAVLPAAIVPGAARLRGPTGCPTGTAVKATVTGRRIVRVTFYVDGRKTRTVTRPDSKGRWSVTLRPGRLAFGQHRVRARVEFASDSGTRARTLRLSFNRCRPAAAKPTFTG